MTQHVHEATTLSCSHDAKAETWLRGSYTQRQPQRKGRSEPVSEKGLHEAATLSGNRNAKAALNQSVKRACRAEQALAGQLAFRQAA